MLKLKYSLVVEVTEDPSYFGFFSLDLEGFSGIGHSVEDCLFPRRIQTRAQEKIAISFHARTFGEVKSSA